MTFQYSQKTQILKAYGQSTMTMQPTVKPADLVTAQPGGSPQKHKELLSGGSSTFSSFWSLESGLISHPMYEIAVLSHERTSHVFTFITPL